MIGCDAAGAGCGVVAGRAVAPLFREVTRRSGDGQPLPELAGKPVARSAVAASRRLSVAETEL